MIKKPGSLNGSLVSLSLVRRNNAHLLACGVNIDGEGIGVGTDGSQAAGAGVVYAAMQPVVLRHRVAGAVVVTLHIVCDAVGLAVDVHIGDALALKEVAGLYAVDGGELDDGADGVLVLIKVTGGSSQHYAYHITAAALVSGRGNKFNVFSRSTAQIPDIFFHFMASVKVGY